MKKRFVVKASKGYRSNFGKEVGRTAYENRRMESGMYDPDYESRRADAIDEFGVLLEDLESELQENVNGNITLDGSISDLAGGSCIFYITPCVNGRKMYNYRLGIECNYADGGSMVAQSESGSFMDTGMSFDDIGQKCYNWLESVL